MQVPLPLDLSAVATIYIASPVGESSPEARPETFIQFQAGLQRQQLS